MFRGWCGGWVWTVLDDSLQHDALNKFPPGPDHSWCQLVVRDTALARQQSTEIEKTRQDSLAKYLSEIGSDWHWHYLRDKERRDKYASLLTWYEHLASFLSLRSCDEFYWGQNWLFVYLIIQTAKTNYKSASHNHLCSVSAMICRTIEIFLSEYNACQLWVIIKEIIKSKKVSVLSVSKTFILYLH